MSGLRLDMSGVRLGGPRQNWQLGTSASGSTWEHLGHLGTSGNIWEHLGASGGIWGDLGTYGNICEHLGASARIWEHLGASARIWCVDDEIIPFIENR